VADRQGRQFDSRVGRRIVFHQRANGADCGRCVEDGLTVPFPRPYILGWLSSTTAFRLRGGVRSSGAARPVADKRFSVGPACRMGSTTVIDLRSIAERAGLPVAAVEATAKLLDEGNTVPFVTRYRRDQTGGLDERQVRFVGELVARARQLADRRQTILRTIEGQGRLTEDMRSRIEGAENPKELEDLYLPFKPRRLSLAEVARERKLEPLAHELLAADAAARDLDVRAADFLDPDAQVATVADALLGVGHIIAHSFSQRADLRQLLREIFYREGHLKSQRTEASGKPISKAAKHFRDYFAFDEHIQKIPPHRILAINRGERAKILRVRIEGPGDVMQSAAESLLVPGDHPHADFLRACVRDALNRLVLPSLEREVRREVTETCESHAVGVFARNLRNLLLQPPVPGRRVLAIDPGFKSGCKAVVVDECGRPLAHDVLHIVGQAEKKEAAAKRIVELVEEHACSVVAIGNGTAGREVETLVAELVAGPLESRGVAYCMVNEAGASVYSTSPYAREELPEHDAAVRSAISIARRLQDPLSELVKIEPANIGVGLYQHDVRARHLHASLDAVVEGCVNYVGVDVNTASPALLEHVAGLNQASAKGIIEWRTANGRFTSRGQFLEVPGVGESAYVQSAGFLKISDGANPLDATWIHPESYGVAQQILEKIGCTPADLTGRQGSERLTTKIAEIDKAVLAEELGVGLLLLEDILEQLVRPGRDPRDDLPKPLFKQGVLKFEDLEVGMELHGSVLNVVDFGAFIDIGMHDSGLVHISQFSRGFVVDPHETLTVGQPIRVWVLELDKSRRRVALTMIPPRPARSRSRPRKDSRAGFRPRAEQGPGRTNGETSERQPRQRPQGAAAPPAGGHRDRHHQRTGRPPAPREQQPRVYVAAHKKQVVPLTADMRAGKEPLRTFGDLKQFLSVRSGETPEGTGDSQAVKPRRRQRTSAAATDPSIRGADAPLTHAADGEQTAGAMAVTDPVVAEDQQTPPQDGGISAPPTPSSAGVESVQEPAPPNLVDSPTGPINAPET
jgi:uncharacterized protein